MICKELLSMEMIRDHLQLMAGEAGLVRTIRWIYFADCVDCLEDQNDWLNWIHGGELVIVTNKNFTNNENQLLQMMRLFNQKTVAGFVVNVGQAPDCAVELADELDLPLFEIDWDLKMVDLSQTLCLALAEEIKIENTQNQLFADLLYPGSLSSQDIIQRAEYYGINLNRAHFVLAFDIDHLTRNVMAHHVPEERRKKCKESLLSYIKGEFYMMGDTPFLTMPQGDAVLMLLPAELFSKEQLEGIISKIQDRFQSINDMTVSVGVGTEYGYVEEFGRSAMEAKQAVKIIHNENRENDIMYYQNMGLYYLITQIKDTKLLGAYYNKILGPLIELDSFSEGCLCETLEKYLEHNCNANETAQALYIHRNTMRYRLEKISRLLHCDLGNLDTCTELNLAFHIKNYVESMQHLQNHFPG